MEANNNLVQIVGKDKKNDKTLIVIIISLIGVILCATGFFLLTGNKDDNNENKTKNDIKINKNDELEIKDDSIFKDITNSLDNVYINEDKLNLNYKSNSDGNGNHNDLYIDDKLMFETNVDGPFIDTILQTNDNYFIIISSHRDVRQRHLYVFDSTGNKVNDIYEFDKNMVKYADSLIDINGENIILKVSRYGDNDAIIMEDGRQLFLCSEEIKNANIDEDYEVLVKYKLTYKGNGQFDYEKIETMDTYYSLTEENCK